MINHDNPRKEGMLDRAAGLDLEDNPHIKSKLPNSYVLWREGWHERDKELQVNT